MPKKKKKKLIIIADRFFFVFILIIFYIWTGEQKKFIKHLLKVIEAHVLGVCFFFPIDMTS